MTHGTNLYSNNDVFTGDELKSYCHLNTAVAILQLATMSHTAVVGLESDHGWEGDIEAALAWVYGEDEEDHANAPWTTQPWSKSGRTCTG